MRKMYVYCDGSFGNRFNVLLSAITLCNIANLEPHIIWRRNNMCGAKLDELFENKFKQFHEFNSHKFFNKNKDLNLLIHENQYHQDLNYTSPFSFTTEEEVLSYTNQNTNDIFFYTNLIPSWATEQRLLTETIPILAFKNDIVQESERYKSSNPKNTYYGLHIRKTDFSAFHSFDEIGYYNHIKDNPNLKFFICSDDEDTEKKFLELPNTFSYLKTKYTEKFIEGDWNMVVTDYNGNQWPFNVNRKSDSVKQALVDLLILSNSNIIDTNSRSTFLQAAILLSKV